MTVRIQFRPRAVGKNREHRNRQLALTLSRWLNPASLAASILALWRLGYDLNWTGGFAFSGGLFSHWQVWMAMAVCLQVFASLLNRYGRGDGATMP